MLPNLDNVALPLHKFEQTRLESSATEKLSVPQTNQQWKNPTLRSARQYDKSLLLKEMISSSTNNVHCEVCSEYWPLENPNFP